MVKQFIPEELNLLEETHAGIEEEHEEETAETCDELIATPIPHPLFHSRREEVETHGVKLSPGRKEGWNKGVQRFSFYFSLFYSALVGNKFT